MCFYDVSRWNVFIMPNENWWTPKSSSERFFPTYSSAKIFQPSVNTLKWRMPNERRCPESAIFYTSTSYVCVVFEKKINGKIFDGKIRPKIELCTRSCLVRRHRVCLPLSEKNQHILHTQYLHTRVRMYICTILL